MRYDAFIRRELTHNSVRIFMAEPGPPGKVRVLMGGIMWQEVDEAVVEGAGIELPHGALDALYEALKIYRGEALDKSTEAAVLRESLEIERARVDRVLDEVNLRGRA